MSSDINEIMVRFWAYIYGYIGCLDHLSKVCEVALIVEGFPQPETGKQFCACMSSKHPSDTHPAMATSHSKSLCRCCIAVVLQIPAQTLQELLLYKHLVARPLSSAVERHQRLRCCKSSGTHVDWNTVPFESDACGAHYD